MQNRFEKVGFFSLGLWKKREEFSCVLNSQQLFLGLGRSLFLSKPDAVLGWGFRNSSQRARNYCKQKYIPYIASEDGFLRSILPGHRDFNRSLILDEHGIYYLAERPSALEKMIVARAKMNENVEGRTVRNAIFTNKLSKYNHAPEVDLGKKFNVASTSATIVIDQTRDDASIRLGLASAQSFLRAVVDALKYDDPIIIKTHPDVFDGRKKGYLGKETLYRLLPKRDFDRLMFLTEPVNPNCVFDIAKRVHVVTSQVGFEALGAGVDVSVYGMPFYAGWGLTNDHLQTNECLVVQNRRKAYGVSPKVEDLYAAMFLDYCVYLTKSGNQFKVSNFRSTVEELIETRAIHFKFR